MSDEPKKRSRAWIQLGVLSLLMLLVSVIAFRFSESVSPENDIPEPGLPQPTFPFVQPARAREIAIKEVKKREGWAGKADRPIILDGACWFVYVWRGPRSPKGEREVAIDASDGRIMSYEAESLDKAYHQRYAQYYP
jgi:hypothetical protein